MQNKIDGNSIIDNMCLTWDHRYFLPTPTPEDLNSFWGGITYMSEKEKSFLKSQMTQIYTNDIAPHIKKLEDEIAALKSELASH